VRRNAWIELDFAVFRENLRTLQAALSAGTQIVLVVKANAYGHGMPAVARQAYASGVSWFLVSRLDEAVELRQALPEGRILLLGAVWPTDVQELMSSRITPVLASVDQAEALAAEARRLGLTLGCHAKIDTGMGRLGFEWQDAAPTLARLKTAGGLAIDGLATHFASAGRPGDPFATLQEERFRQVLRACEQCGLQGLFRHISNSAAFAAQSPWDMDGVRLGIITYGYGGKGQRVSTHPFLHWKTRVVQVKPVPAGFPVGYLSTHVTSAPTWLATVDVGYSDGFSRLLSNKGCVLVGGRRAPVVGRVTMNFITVDVGPQGGVCPGDEVVLIGRQGGEAVWADELARWCQTIPYEILTSIRSDTVVCRD
jgi:alanine racemase